MNLRLIIILTFLLLSGAVRAQLVRQANTTLTLPADLPSATGYTTTNAITFQGGGGMTFFNPICTAYPPGETNRLYVLERGTDTPNNTPPLDYIGRIQVVNNLSSGTPSQATFMDLETYLESAPVNTPLAARGDNSENGMLSMVFHPNYNQNGYFYVYFSITVPGQPANTFHQRLARFKATGTPGNYNAATSANPATMMPILTIYDEAGNHNGGDLAFGNDGYLYLSLGDEGGGGDQYNNARFINKDFWGQMIRIAVADINPETGLDEFPPNTIAPNAHSQPASTSHPSAIHAGTYRVPADNPFIGATTWHNLAITPSTVRTEIYATGLRNPFRFTIDPPTGRIFLGDVGQNLYEEVDLIVKGGDYGWSWREGLHDFVGEPAPTTPPAMGFNPVNPIYEYDDTNDGTGNDSVIYGTSVCGGLIYRGNLLTELQGKLLFSDIFGGGGIIAALTETSPGVWTGQRLAIRPQIVDFGTDPRNGEPLLTSLLGTIYKLQRSGTSGTPPPALLSQTGAFSSLTTMTPQAGIVPYDPNVAFWSDYAIKSRWFSIKNTTDTIGFSADGNWTFPTGMVWVKHFDFDRVRGNASTRRRLETRFLVKTATDVYGLSYRWNNFDPALGAQTDATLVAEEGLTELIPTSSPAQTWRFPSRGECRTCHTAMGGFALSFNTRQLNRTMQYGAQMLNQIAALRDAVNPSSQPLSYFSAATAPATTNNLARFVRADDTASSFEARVRSYLAVNCVQCHQPGGGAQGAWDARPTIATDLAGLINGVLVNNFQDGDNRWCVPGDAPAFGVETHSVALRRLRGDGVPRMPPLATSERDLVAEQLLTDWILQELPPRQSFSQWQMSNFGSTTAPQAQPAFDGDSDGANNSLEFLRRTSPVVPNAPPATTLADAGGGQFALQFEHPANRSCLIETTTDFQSWSLWNAEGNSPFYPATTTTRTLIGPVQSANQYFRLRLTTP